MFSQTPSQTIGPFFQQALLTEKQDCLINAHTLGERIRIQGHLLDGNGEPVFDGLIEIWQADTNGIFHHPADPRILQADASFRGFGRSDTAGDGVFRFETVKPGSVPGSDQQVQAPHVNLRIFARGLLKHAVTRLYFAGEAANEADPVLNAIEPQRRRTLIAQRKESGDIPCYHLDIRLQGENETVFFEL